MQAITFAAGVYIILAGVRMLIAEIIPAFKGIADKLVPNTKPALDCPTIFPFAPNAVIIGFIFSFLAGLVSMFILPSSDLRSSFRVLFPISSQVQQLASLVTLQAAESVPCQEPLPMVY